MNEAAGSTAPLNELRGARLRAALPYAALIASVLSVYAGGLAAGFVADDATYLRLSSRVRTAVDLIPFFTTPIQLNPVLAPNETRVYRPAYMAYGALAYRLWGNQPWAWHAANVMLHALAACLVLITMRRLFGLPPRAALLASLLWAVHPVQVQAVMYVSAVAYLLMGLFLLVAVLVACGGWPARLPWPARALVAAGAFTVSVLNHELGIMAPALALLALAAAPGLGWARGHRLDRGTMGAAAAMGAAAVGYVILRLTVIGTGQAGRLSEAVGGMGARLLQAPEIFLRYLALLAFPARLTLDRSHDVPAPAGALDARLLGAWALFALLIYTVARAARRVPSAAIGGAWFFLAYFPTSNTLIPLYSVMGEQYIYVASLGVVAGTVAAARALGIPRAAALAGTVLVVAYGARSVVRTRDWRDDLSFYTAAVAASPRSANMHNHLGNSYHRRGDLDRAEREFRAAVAADPSYHAAYYNLGNLAMDRENLDEAEAFYRRAVALRPDYAEAYYNLAVVAHRRGQTREAIGWLERASALRPDRAETHLNLGMTFLALDPDRAAWHLRRFLALAPDHPQASAVRARLSTLPQTPSR